MHIEGTIIAEIAIKQGKTKEGNDWRTKRYVIRYDANDKYDKSVAFDVYGDNIEKFGIQVGQEYSIDIDIQARQWKDDYFNQIRAWRCYPKNQQQQTTMESQINQQPAQPQQPASADNGLPF